MKEIEMKNKNTGNLTTDRHIRAARSPILIGADDGKVLRGPSSGLLVYQTGGQSESRAFNFYESAGYILNVIITINLPHFAIATFGLELPWETYVWWLDEPNEVEGRATIYRFDRSYPLEFEKRQVLNHLADVQRTYSRGKSLKGHLLGIGNKAIPDRFQQGEMIPAFLIIYDQFGREYRSPISLWTDRNLQPVRPASSAIRRKGGLLDSPDPGFEHVPPEKEDEAKK
jgi:hypothetical protein